MPSRQQRLFARFVLATSLVAPALLAAGAFGGGFAVAAPPPVAFGARRGVGIEKLGERLFNDTNLSVSGTEACATCHDPARAFTGNNNPDPLFPVATGAYSNLVG